MSACASILAGSLATGAPAVADTLALPESPCKNVTVLGLKGTDVSEKAVAPKVQVQGSGIVNQTIYSKISELLPEDQTRELVVIPYTESKVTGAPMDETDVTQFRSDISAATDLALKSISDTLAKCSNTKIVIMGFQQGAQIAHEAALRIPNDMMDSIGAIILTSDPLHDPSDANQYSYYGAAGLSKDKTGGQWITPTAQSIGPYLDLIPKMAPANSKFTAQLWPKVVSLCNRSDISADASCRSHTGASNINPLDAYLTNQYSRTAAEMTVQRINNLCSDVTFFAARGSGEPASESTSDPYYEKPKDAEKVLRRSGDPVLGDYYKQTSRIPDYTDIESPSTSDYREGFGVTLSSLAFSIQSKYPNDSTKTFGHEAVKYDAISVPDAGKNPKNYPLSVKSGITADTGQQQLRDLIQRCPVTKIVAMGYSQGGHVMHEIMLSLTKEERAHVSATILVADAIRNPADKAPLTFMGTNVSFEMSESKIFQGKGGIRVLSDFQRGCYVQGVLKNTVGAVGEFFQTQIGGLVGGSNTAACAILPYDPTFPDVVAEENYADDMNLRTLNVCALKDIVCDTQFSVKSESDYGTLWDNLNQVDEVHGDGYKTPLFYNFPAGWAYGRLLRP